MHHGDSRAHRFSGTRVPQLRSVIEVSNVRRLDQAHCFGVTKKVTFATGKIVAPANYPHKLTNRRSVGSAAGAAERGSKLHGVTAAALLSRRLRVSRRQPPRRVGAGT